MSLEIVVTTDRWKSDPAARSFVEQMSARQVDLDLERAVLYYDFPAYVDYETATSRPDILILSPAHGFVAVRFVEPSLFQRSADDIDTIDDSLNDFSSHLYSRILRSRELRKSRTQAVIEVAPVLLGNLEDDGNFDAARIDSHYCASLGAFEQYLDELRGPALDQKLFAEVRSIVEGAKALTRPQKRSITDPDTQPLAVAISSLEAEIANFDQKQRHFALVDVGGPGRIRGLAGSGKTVILAMKAAHLHLNYPDANILVTFYTKSLRDTIRNLITKFYRHYSETDPNWKLLQVRHGWGGSAVPGVYSDACQRHNQSPLRFPDARRLAKKDETAFAAACNHLQTAVEIRPFYDYVLIDEGQDFPASFYQLCYRLTKGERDRKHIVWAYDELQDIMNVKIRQPDELFGLDVDGTPRVDLDRSSRYVPPGATNDAVLEKCYRNQRNILVTAHALGFGVYGTVVQMLESAAHWRDVGYDVVTGDLRTGQQVVVMRPDRNSPLPLPETKDCPLLNSLHANSIDDEVAWATNEIVKFIGGGLAAEDVLVIAMDDRHAKRYLSQISEALASNGIGSNNIIADPYNEPPFSIAGRVTLSTVYRAKGNEAAAVVAVGVDAVETRGRDGRNKLFTAFTRTKAWLRVSGTGAAAGPILKELSEAYAAAPEIRFTMPNLKEIETIQRGFSKKQAAARKAREEYLRRLREAGFSEDEIEEQLRSGAGDE